MSAFAEVSEDEVEIMASCDEWACAQSRKRPRKAAEDDADGTLAELLASRTLAKSTTPVVAVPLEVTRAEFMNLKRHCAHLCAALNPSFSLEDSLALLALDPPKDDERSAVLVRAKPEGIEEVRALFDADSRIGGYKVVQNVWEVKHYAHVLRYHARVAQIRRENRGDANVRLMLHGTVNTDAILANGFDSRHCKDVSAFGRGVYFCSRPSYSDLYAGPPGVRVMLVCEVARGRLGKGCVGQKLPDKGCHCAIHRGPTEDIVCIFVNSQALVKYKVEYVSTRLTDC
jgi:hypothetical protein